MERNKKKKITQISRLRPGFKHWKIKAKIVKSLTPNEQQKTFRNKNNAGRKCIYLLGDDSGKIKLLSFGEYAERLESLQINEEYYISGAELGLSNKNYHQDNKYQLTVNEYTVIEPVGGGPSPCTLAQVGEEVMKKRKVELTPIPLKQVHEDSNSEEHFDVMGIMKKGSKPEFKQYKNSTYYREKITLIETTGEISIQVSANLQQDLKKLTDLKDQVIGFFGCHWKHYDKVCIYAQLDNLCEEKDLPDNLKVRVQNLKEWWCTQQKRSPRKRLAPSEKKSLHESAVGDPEIVPSKKRKIGSKMPLTRSKESGKNEKDDEDLSFENEDEDGVVKKKSKNTAINRPKSIAEVKKGRESTAGKKEASRRIDREHGSDREAEVSNWKKKDEERKQPVRKTLEEDKKKVKKFKQRPATEKERSNPQTKKSKKLQIEAKSVSGFRPSSTHLFSKGAHNQKEVFTSIIRAKVSESIGLIHIDGDAKGTGFRVGNKYIVTCVHVIKSAMKAPHFIDSKLVSIEFDRTKYNKKEDPDKIFDLIDIVYSDEEHDFAVLELGTHDSGVPFPPALTCFGEVICSDVYLVGHPGCRQMMEDNVIPYWLPEYKKILLPEIKRLGEWSKTFFPDGKDYYKELKKLPRKIMFHSTFDHGSSGSPGVLIKDEKPCVVLMVRGGVPTCVYENIFPTHTSHVEDDYKVEYGYAMSDIYNKMKTSEKPSAQKLAPEIFKTWME